MILAPDINIQAYFSYLLTYTHTERDSAVIILMTILSATWIQLYCTAIFQRLNVLCFLTLMSTL